MHKFTDEQFEFIKNNVTGTKSDELTKMFNNHFGLSLKPSQIRTFMKNHKFKNGIDTRFKKGQIPFNKGKKGIGGWEPTQFKKGNIPHNRKAIGTERINDEGYVDVKIQDGQGHKNWKPKHQIIWEEKNGPVPKGHVIIFADRNKLNLDIDNLILISRKQFITLNKSRLIQNNADLTKTGIVIADIHNKISKLKSEHRTRSEKGVDPGE